MPYFNSDKRQCWSTQWPACWIVFTQKSIKSLLGLPTEISFTVNIIIYSSLDKGLVFIYMHLNLKVYLLYKRDLSLSFGERNSSRHMICMSLNILIVWCFLAMPAFAITAVSTTGARGTCSQVMKHAQEWIGLTSVTTCPLPTLQNHSEHWAHCSMFYCINP